MNASNYFEANVLGVFSGNRFAAGSTIYIGLSVTEPREDGSNIQPPTYPNYALQVFEATTPAPYSGGIGIQNAFQIDFPTPNADAGTINYVVLMDSKTGGNMLAYSKLNEAKPIKAGTTPNLLANEAKFWITGNHSSPFNTIIMNYYKGVSIEPQEVWATLYNGSPESGGVELIGGTLKRQRVTMSMPSETSPSTAHTIANTAEVVSDVSSQNMGEFNYSAFFNAETGGMLLFSKQLPNTGIPYTLSKGDRWRFGINDIKHSFS